MATMFFSFVFMMLVVGGMAVGVLFGRKPISGSCGGMKALGMNMECEVCGGDPGRCETEQGPANAAGLAVDATPVDSAAVDSAAVDSAAVESAPKVTRTL